jgi:putative lipoic acid-binding regulatory protein
MAGPAWRDMTSEKNDPRPAVTSFPAEVTFKAVFYSSHSLGDNLDRVFREHEVEPQLKSKTSRNGKFTSYTVTATFQSEAHLQKVCAGIAAIKGYTTMF